MISFSRIALLLLLVFSLSACKEGKKNEVATKVPIQTTNISVQEYDGVKADIRLQGTLAIANLSDLDIMEVYTNDTCSGARAGTTLVRDFESSGIEIEVPSTATVELFVSTVNTSECLFFTEFSPADLKPTSPKFSSLSPVSPSKATFQPGIYGTSYPNSAKVKFFSDQSCTTSVGQGDVTDYEGVGLQITLTPNAVTPVFGLTEDPLGQLSECVSLTEFRHANLVLPVPLFSAALPASPNNSTNQPLIQGVADPTAQSVDLFSDSGCSMHLATGELTDFASGMAVSLSSNVTNGVYGRITDDLDNKSPCTFLTTYVHDTIGPSDPTYVSASPTSPTNATTAPLLTGTAPADALLTRFYDSSFCIVQLGAGLSSSFTSGGLAANLPANETASIYAKNFDAAGNGSACVYMTDYKHNTVPPNAPNFGGTTPLSPTNGTTDPLIFGTPSVFTVSLNFYEDEFCANFAGSGSHTVFQSPGIMVSLTANTNNTVYTRVYDIEGNESNCFFLGGYDHSNVAAPAPAFLFSFPASPNRTSTTPFIIGTAHNSIASVQIFDDNSCTGSLGNGTRAQFVSSGVQISVPANSTTDLHAISTDVYGNVSGCTSLTQYIHNTVPPLDPTFTSELPATPNNISYSPTISGAALTDPSSQLLPNEVEFYDSGICVNKLGEGTPAEFAGAGIVVNAYRNAVTSIYARSFDAAGNSSNCVLMVNYTHDDLQPGQPVFLTVNPTSPAFTPQTVITGYYGTSTDFLNKVSMGIYSDSGCSTPLATGAPADYTGVGLTVTLPENTTTLLYGNTVNEVGTLSNCNYLTSFRHYDLPPSSMAANANFDGSVAVSWLPDPVSTAVLNYTLERSTSTLGPFTVLATGLVSNTFKDIAIVEGQDYYYRTFTSNSTGRSQYSAPAGITITSPPPQQALSLVAYPGPGEVYLSWSGFPQNMSYKIYRATQKGGPFQPLEASPTTTTYEDNQAINDTTYYYYVIGTNPSGDSMQSNIATVVPKSNPSAPTEFKITPVFASSSCAGASGLHLSWAGSQYFENFNIYGGFGNAGRGSTSLQQHVVCSGSLNGNEVLSVRGNWGQGQSAKSNTENFRSVTGPVFNVYPGHNEVVLQWQENDGGTWYSTWGARYDIYRATNRNGPYTLVQADYIGTNYTDSTVTNGTSYFYYIQAFARNASSKKLYVGYPSLTSSATPSTMPSAPSNLILTYDESLAIKLDWQTDSHYNYFKIYSSASPGGPFIQATTTVNRFLYGAPASEGMNYYRISVVWGTSETAVTNTVSFRKASINGLAAVSSSTNIQLNWLDVVGVLDYEVFRASMIGGPYSSVGTSGTSDFTDSTVSVGQGHYYRLRARFADATEGELSSVVKGMRTGTPFTSGVSASNITSNSFTVNWNTVLGATKYEVHVATLVGGPYVKKAEHASLTTLNANGLLARTQYYFFVRSLVGGTNYDSSPPATASTFGKPSAPLFTPRNNEVNLSWTPSIGAVSYDLTRSTDGMTFAPVVAAHPTSSYLDTGVTNGTMYFYKLTVNYPSGSISSDSTTGVVPGVIPYAPGSLSVKSDGSGTGALLSWGQVDGYNSYSIYRATSVGGPFVTPISTTSSFENVLDTGLTTGTSYYYQVRARNGDMLSTPTAVVGFIPSLDQTAPLVARANAGAVTISWGSVAGATQYDLYRSDTTEHFELLASGIGALGYEDSTITPAKTYFYYYIPKTATGVEYAKSLVSQAVNISVTPLAPQGVNASVNSLTSVDLEWFPVPNAALYEVHRSTITGGPYTLLASVTLPSVVYNDSTVVGGQSYFYIVRTINGSQVASADSAEVGVRIVAGPTGLALGNGPTGISVSWNSVAGASQYSIKRSDWTGGPYGIVGSTAATSFIDTATSPQKNYYYVVQAEFADGELSEESTESSLLRNGVVDLVVPVEMIDQGVGSANSENRVFERSRTYIDTNYYDGTVTYSWVVIAANTEGVAREIRLKDGANVEVSAITVAGNTTTPTRFVQTMSLNAGADSYRLELEQSTLDSQLQVFNSQIQIEQVGASKTRLYYPLLTYDGSVSSTDQGLSSLATTLSSYQALNHALRYRREANHLAKIVDYNAWELEALVSTDSGSTGSVQFYNKSTSTAVPMTETNFSSSSIQRARIFIDEGVTQFASINEDEDYEVQIRCDFNCDLGGPRIHKAGLWVELENLTNAVVVYRNSPQYISASGSQQMTNHRNLLNTAMFSNGQYYFQVDAEEDGASSGSVELQSHAQDSGAVGLSTVGSSSMVFNSDSRQVQRSGALTLSSGDRFVTRIIPMSGNLDVYSSSIVIHVNSP